jgi:cyclophilin family peptidyl-prolyl cis-trans isomerase
MKSTFSTLACLLAVAGAAFGAPQAAPPPAASQAPPPAAAPAPAADYPQVSIETNKGKIVVELFADKAPKTVENFLQYVKSGFYNDTLFHRVITGFMVQTGGIGLDSQQKATKGPILNEADNRVHNDRGTLAMARTGDPHSAKAQFFINLKDNGFLNHTGKNPNGWGYCVFGRVIEGMDVVDAIAAVPVNTPGKLSEAQPIEPVVITRMAMVPTPKK